MFHSIEYLASIIDLRHIIFTTRDKFILGTNYFGSQSLIVGCQKQFFFFFYQVARNMYGPSNKVKKRGLGDLFTTKNLNVIANLLLLFSSWLKTSFLIIKKKLNTFSLIYRGHLQNENLEAAIKWFSRKTEKGQDDFLVELTIINCLHRKQIWYTSKVDYFCEPNWGVLQNHKILLLSRIIGS